MRIGIDIDDTIADSYELWFAYAQRYTVEELGRSGKVQDVVSNHHFYLKLMHNWSDEEESTFWDKYYIEIISKIKPLTFAVETINKLKNDGHEIIIITARYPEKNFDVEEETKKWFDKNNIKYDKLEFNVQDKSKIAIEDKIDIFIDDSFKNCSDVANVGIKTFLMNTRTNKGLEAENITRVYSWPDIYNRIKKEEND